MADLEKYYAGFLVNRANLFKDMNEPDRAISDQFEAIGIYERLLKNSYHIEITLHLAMSLLNIAISFIEMNVYADGLVYVRRSLDIWERLVVQEGYQIEFSLQYKMGKANILKCLERHLEADVLFVEIKDKVKEFNSITQGFCYSEFLKLFDGST